MPDKYGFDHLPDWGRIYVQCIEKECNAGGSLSVWPEEKRKIHHLTHVVSVNKEFSGEIRTDTCRICNGAFEQERKRGRPRVVCYSCKPE